MRIPSVMSGSHRFSQVPSATIERSTFDRSFGVKTTFDGGLLVPVMVDEVLPGDTYKCQMTAFARLATPLKPIMDNMWLESFFFFVPYRLVWANWVKFCGEQTNPGDSISFVVPQQVPATAAGYGTHSLEDYFGLPVGIQGNLSHSTLPRRAYYLIHNQWFRDENIQSSAVVSTGDGPDVIPAGGSLVFNRGKRHDYFTSCLPFPQKGTAVVLPLGTTAPVVQAATNPTPTFRNVGSTVDNGQLVATTSADQPTVSVTSPTGSWTAGEALYWKTSGLEANLATATAATINQLRQAFQIQKLLERDARGGTRYTEIVRSHFGVVSPDARLQRPEYLGGGSSPVLVSPVTQTAPQQAAGVTTPQGNLAAIGTVTAMGHGFAKSFTEHGIVMGLVCVRADLNYQQGLERMWSRSTRYDFYWPALAHIGEQAVLNKEIYCQGDANDPLVFGYQERYAEYRYKPSIITGLFRSQAPGTLHIWHLAQQFTALPTLNSLFISEIPPIDRVIAVTSEPHFLFDGYFRMQCARPMPVYGVPGLIDHF